jgi:GDPmannose 4,6-dehydratase
MSTEALVLGVNGQDGSYLAEHLLARGRRVTGVGRQPESRHVPPQPRFQYVSLDLTDLDDLERLLAERRPGSIFHFAAVHGASGFAYEPVWRDLQLVNVAVTHCVLEHLRARKGEGHLLFPSSAKVFGSAPPARISEETPRVSDCLYTITKNAGHELVRYYRTRHGVRATVVVLFNHESPRRPSDFLVPTLVRAVAEALSGAGAHLEIRTDDFHCNWGDAREYMEVCVDLAEAGVEDDVIVAHERTWYGRDFVHELFARYGLSCEDHVTARHRGERSPSFEVDTGRLEKTLGRRPTRGILEVCDDILRENHPRVGGRDPPPPPGRGCD